tara:strand:+ start:535 stop:1128 length:594 start_codon:yes stop_codon:yes gene_type:complete
MSKFIPTSPNFTFPYFGPLIGKTCVTPQQLKNIKQICNKKISHRKNLAGHIKDEYIVDPKMYDTIIGPQLESFKGCYKMYYNRELKSIKTKVAWVNYMKAGDFNPPHIHTNCRFSSVLFVHIPKELKKECDKHEGTSEGPGCIEFRYGEAQLRDNLNVHTIFPKEGDMFIFPAFVTHFVYPFKSKNVKRISVAANFD